MPFYAEYLYLAVKEESEVESVHLTAWPEGGEVNMDIIIDMAAAREIVTKALEARTKAGIKVRQPIAELMIPVLLGDSFIEVIKEEMNVKKVTVVESEDMSSVWVDTVITPELKAEGEVREFMRAVQEKRKQDGLEPQDRVALVVQATSEGRQVLETFKEMLTKTVGATELMFTDVEGDSVTAGEHTFVIALKKL